MAKEPSNLAKAFQYLVQGIALRKERAPNGGKSTASLIISETRGDICDEQLRVVEAQITATKAELENCAENNAAQLENELRSLEEKRIQIIEQRNKFYREAEATTKLDN